MLCSHPVWSRVFGGSVDHVTRDQVRRDGEDHPGAQPALTRHHEQCGALHLDVQHPELRELLDPLWRLRIERVIGRVEAGVRRKAASRTSSSATPFSITVSSKSGYRGVAGRDIGGGGAVVPERALAHDHVPTSTCGWSAAVLPTRMNTRPPTRASSSTPIAVDGQPIPLEQTVISRPL